MPKYYMNNLECCIKAHSFVLIRRLIVYAIQTDSIINEWFSVSSTFLFDFYNYFIISNFVVINFILFFVVMNKLNMGCGNDIKEGYLNVDIVDLPGVDKVFDFETYPYPFEDDYFDEIYCSHILEHMSDLGKVMDEFYRIGKNGCKIKVKVPYFASPNAMGDYTHKRMFNSHSFEYFTKDCYYNSVNLEIKKQRIHWLSNHKFLESEGIGNSIIDPIINLFPIIYERFFCYIIPCVEIHYLLEIKK